MKPVTVGTRQVVHIPHDHLHHAVVSYNHKLLNGAVAMDQVTHQRGYPPEARPPIEEHLARLEAQGKIEPNSWTFVEPIRNMVNNPFCVGYTHEHGLCEERNENARSSPRTYYGIGCTNGNRIGAYEIDFSKDPTYLDWFVTGVPVLWNGRNMTLSDLASVVSDQAHLWEIRDDEPNTRRLALEFDKRRGATAEEASAAMLTATAGLPRERNYLHQAIGIGPGGYFSIVATGPLETIGAVALEAGATHAIVTQNGGSVTQALRKPDGSLRHLLESYYFREPTVALVALQLTSDDTDRAPFQVSSGLVGL